MVAQSRQQDVGNALLAFNLYLILVDEGTKFALWRLVFNGATDGTGLAADTASQAKREIAPEPAEPVMRQRSGRPVAGETAVYCCPYFLPSRCNNETLVTPLICV
ncbi:unnamed protein product [Enterobius vermicularis]|uniref:Transposase n=1 Tax=Enterobius vermicularis TaxID=51028 RepID=A0A0N4UU68_ENTVE|nr:unnamed protein product [Enterobius vermicularis]